jgi:hypothetical protein
MEDSMPRKKSGKKQTSDVEKRKADAERRERELEELEEEPLIAEEPLESLGEDDVDVDEELSEEELYNTLDSDGSTYNPWLADDQGLTYTPPYDSPVRPDQGATENVEVAAGFAPSMEDANPDEEELPEEVDEGDLDREEDIYTALRDHAETAHLTNVRVHVRDGVVTLWGTVFSEDDIGAVDDIVTYMDGVVDVHNNLEVEE